MHQGLLFGPIGQMDLRQAEMQPALFRTGVDLFSQIERCAEILLSLLCFILSQSHVSQVSQTEDFLRVIIDL